MTIMRCIGYKLARIRLQTTRPGVLFLPLPGADAASIQRRPPILRHLGRLFLPLPVLS